MSNAITRVEIQNFLVFKGEFAADFCPGVNVLIGGNGSGKTTLMKVMYAALASEKDVNAANILKQQGKQVIGHSFIPMRSVYWREIVPPTPGNSPARYSVSVCGTNVHGKPVTTTTKTTNEYIGVNGSNGRPIPTSQIPEALRILRLDQGENILVKSSVFIPEFDLLRVVQNFRKEVDLFINGKANTQTQWLNESVLDQEQNANGNLGRLIEDMIHLYCPDSTSKSLFIQLFNLATTAQAFFTEKKAAEVCDNIGKRLEDKGIVFSGVTFSQDLQSFVFANGVSAMYEASGVRKFGLLWLLIKYKLLELSKNSVLFWDEPENSLNPELVPVLVDILLELSQKGVQVFIATHSYDIARWFELSKKSDNTLRYLNLRKEDDRVVADVTDDYISLENNLIDEADDRLFKRVVEFSTEKAGVKLK